MKKITQAYLGFGTAIVSLVTSHAVLVDSRIPNILMGFTGLIIGIKSLIDSNNDNKQLTKIQREHNSTSKHNQEEILTITSENNRILKEIRDKDKGDNEDAKLKSMMRRFRFALNRNQIPLEEMIEKFSKPIRTIVVYAFKNNTIKKRLLKHGFRYLGGMGVYVLPPNRFPSNIKESDLKNWIKKNIVQDIEESEHQIPFAFTIDLRHVFCSQKIAEGGRNWKTLLQVLGIDEAFVQDYSVYNLLKDSSISLSKIVKTGDINFLLSPYIEDENEFYNIYTKKKKIQDKIIESLNKQGNFKLDYITEISESKLASILNLYLKEANASDVAKQLKSEAKFWEEIIKEF